MVNSYSNDTALKEFPFMPELGTLYRGKVRDNYTRDETRISIATDRVSAFDVVFDEPIPQKGAVLTQIARYWFDATSSIVPNHVISCPDPQVLIVKECKPFGLEFIVRGYLAGSAWKDYAAGKREKCGVSLSEGMKKNQKFDHPIITNTTKAKEGHDVDISRKDILEQKLLCEEQLSEIEDIMRTLYDCGTKIAAQRGLILVDTKYEFGLDSEKNIVLIDEVHTPDSSRYWYTSSYEERFATEQNQQELSKEFLRHWLKTQGFSGEHGQKKPSLPAQVIQETSDRYLELYKILTGKELDTNTSPISQRITSNLLSAGIMKGGYVQIITGSKSDSTHYERIEKKLQDLNIPHGTQVLSAHKNTQQLIDFLKTMNASGEPVVYITVAGKSNALGGIIGAPANNIRGFPVINCPAFKDTTDYLINIHSSLQLPSEVPVPTILNPESAALFAQNILRMAGAKV